MRWLYLFIFPICLISCDDQLEIDFPPTRTLTVVEGKINDSDSVHWVRITKTTDFSSDSRPPIVEDARVEVRSRLGNRITFSHVGNGLYQTDGVYFGETGNQYQLRVYLADGDTIFSDFEELREVHDIDILTYDFYEGETELIPGEVTTIYYPVIFAQDPPDEKNYYSWTISRNDTTFTGPENLILYEDRFFSGYYKNEFTSFEFLEDDKMSLEVSSLSFNAFSYLQQFRSQTLSLGTGNGLPPSVLRGNLVNITDPNDLVLGYFYCSSVKKANIVISP